MCSRPVGRMPLRTRFLFSWAFSALGGTLMSPSATGFRCNRRVGIGAAHPGAEQVSGDDHALNLAGAFINGERASVAIHAFHVALARIAHAAVNLHGLIGHAVGHLGGKKFGARSISAEAGQSPFRARVARRVSQAGRLPNPEAAPPDLRLPI